MIKKTVTWEDLDGAQQTGDFYFHLSAKQFAKIESSIPGGIEAAMKQALAGENRAQILETFETIIVEAYGIRRDGTADFERNPAEGKKFMDSMAGDALFDEIFTDEDALTEFISGLLSKRLTTQVLAAVPAPASPDDQPAWVKEERDPTDAELLSMSHPELIEAMRRRIQGRPVPDSPQA